MSNMYSLLNYIATSKEVFDSSSMVQHHPLTNGKGQELTENSLGLGLGGGLSDDDHRLISISTISVVTRLALEFKMEEVTRLTISLLLQRLRSDRSNSGVGIVNYPAEPAVEAAITYNLVDLALEPTAPEGTFVDVIRGFSAINSASASANAKVEGEDWRFSNNMVSSPFLRGHFNLSHSFSRFLRLKHASHKNCTAVPNYMISTWWNS